MGTLVSYLDHAAAADQLTAAARSAAARLSELDLAAYAASKQRAREATLAAMRAAAEADAAGFGGPHPAARR